MGLPAPGSSAARRRRDVVSPPEVTAAGRALPPRPEAQRVGAIKHLPGEASTRPPLPALLAPAVQSDPGGLAATRYRDPPSHPTDGARESGSALPDPRDRGPPLAGSRGPAGSPPAVWQSRLAIYGRVCARLPVQPFIFPQPRMASGTERPNAAWSHTTLATMKIPAGTGQNRSLLSRLPWRGESGAASETRPYDEALRREKPARYRAGCPRQTSTIRAHPT